MEAKVFRALLVFVLAMSHLRRGPRRQFCDRWIIMIFIWAVINDRPVSWACDEHNWPRDLLDRPLPSCATMSRRLRSADVVELMERVLTALAEKQPTPLVKTIDSKPLLVGAYSKDRDAKRGRVAARLFARGYRLHAIFHGRSVRSWIVTSMNDNDSTIGPKLLEKLTGGGGYAVGDNAYDTNECHEHAARADHQLIAPARWVNREVRDAKYNVPQRLRALDMLASPLEKCGTPNAFGISIYNYRESAESAFGELTMRGLNYLPTWVRGRRRVALWTSAKLILHNLRSLKRQRLREADAKG